MALEDFYQLGEDGDSIIVDSDGVIVDTNIDSPLLYVAQRRHEAKTQAKAYEDYIQSLDRVLLKNQTDPKLAYGDVVVSIRGGRYSTINGEAFADLVWEVINGDEHNDAIERLLAVIAAGTAYRAEPDAKDPAKAHLEPEIAAVLDKAREWHEKRAWVETAVARKPAPKLRVVADPDAEPVPA